MKTNELGDVQWDSLNELFWLFNLLDIKAGARAWEELTGFETDS
jgi:hypothetical protein